MAESLHKYWAFYPEDLWNLQIENFFPSALDIVIVLTDGIKFNDSRVLDNIVSKSDTFNLGDHQEFMFTFLDIAKLSDERPTFTNIIVRSDIVKIIESPIINTFKIWFQKAVSVPGWVKRELIADRYWFVGQWFQSSWFLDILGSFWPKVTKMTSRWIKK